MHSGPLRIDLRLIARVPLPTLLCSLIHDYLALAEYESPRNITNFASNRVSGLSVPILKPEVVVRRNIGKVSFGRNFRFETV